MFWDIFLSSLFLIIAILVVGLIVSKFLSSSGE